MRLCIDIGNTRIKWAVFDKDDNIVHKEIFENNYESKLEKLFSNYNIETSISSSTRKKASSMEQMVGRYSNHIILSHTTAMPFKNEYATPETLGRDRLAGVAAAHMQYRGESSVVIDAGTCITYDFIDNAGIYRGGNIAPGMHMRLAAMNHFTDGLPMVEAKLPESFLGNSTKTALQNGAIRGTILEIESFLLTMSKKYGALNVILTGGDADFFGELLNTEIFVSPNLILIGLNEILKYNA